MVAATAALAGEHDFAAFQGRGSDVKTTVRRMLAAELVEDRTSTPNSRWLSSDLASAGAADGRLLRFEITGTGFLRHMVRTIVGTLVDIGRGKHRTRRHGGDHRITRSLAAPGKPRLPQGLMLWKVTY